MAEYEVVEKFVSINGEGTRAGELAVFVRFKGCNLKCSYCDTAWANEPECEYSVMTEADIERYIMESRVNNVTLTGGEPLLRKNMDILLERLAAIPDISIEIETNGSIDIGKYKEIADNIIFTVDYKLPASKMAEKMHMPNYGIVGVNDTVKFVAATKNDLDTAKDIIERYNLTDKTNVYISSAFGELEPKDIVSYMVDNNMNKVKLQLQIHKFIWEPNRKGV